MPGKRSDPKKLAKERAAIARDIERREAPSFIESILHKIAGRRARKAGYGPAPQREGAEVIGFKKERREA